MAASRLSSIPARLVLGCVIAAVVGLVLVGGLEGGLRLFGSGHAPGFWRTERDAAGRSWIRENWWVTAPYFAPELMRRPQAFRLPETKPAGAYRIFVLGSSAAMGDPEPSFSIARVLETMLRSAYPKIEFDVVNAGITAINSHVVRGIAEDCAQLQPDLYIVYEGNNEVIGPFGPATVFTPVLRRPGAIRAAIYLRGLRIGQLLTNAAHRETGSGGPDEWGGMQMFLQHRIAADDPRLETTRQLFADNLRAISRAGTRAGASVVLCTVLTNEKDFAPFQSQHATGLSPAQLATWESAEKAGLDSESIGDWFGAEEHFHDAVTADSLFAESHFQLARAELKLGKRSEAKRDFQRALDLDTLRFRTDSRLNDTIREVAGALGSRVSLCDLVKTAEAQSPEGILGDEMLYEHVHLSFRGTYVVARELFQKISDDLVRRGRLGASDVTSEPLPIEAVRERLAFTTYEQAMIVKDLLGRFQRAPFTAQSDDAARIAAFVQRDRRAGQLLALPESADAIFTIYKQAIASNPGDWVLLRNYGMALAAMGRGAEAKAQLLRALEIIPDDPDTIYSLILAHRELGEKAEAIRRAEQLKRLEPKYPGLAELKL